MEQVKHQLVDEFASELNEVKMMEVGSEKHKTAVDSVTKLADRIIEIEKIEAENEAKAKAQADENHDRKVKNRIAIGTFVGSVLVYGASFVASTKFEQFGSFTTEGGRNAIKNLLKLKR